MSALYRPMSISKKICSCLRRSHQQYIYFYEKSGIGGGGYLYVSHTLFILYLESNHALFGEKIYFIWKFSSGNSGGIVIGQVTVFSTAFHTVQYNAQPPDTCNKWIH